MRGDFDANRLYAPHAFGTDGKEAVGGSVGQRERHFARRFAPSSDSTRQLSEETATACTDARTGSSPHAAFCFGSLQPSFARIAARFSLSQHVAACAGGLLIPRSQVRSLPGPCDLQAFCWNSPSRAYLCAYAQASTRATIEPASLQ